ncbi:MAG: ABC transporter [Halobacteriovoraceae bacterium]|nr:ABC transporter [Halobacteriovoraceae bacterium]|tara:strand:- start:7217 stop:8074 length:858 start_codon:yes stop_codon:yes gene_type:complete
MLEFCEITKIFKSDLLKKPFQALDQVSFTIPEGKIIGFLGANGAGKTTSIKIIMDFIRPTQGEVKYGSALGSNKANAFKYIGYLPERPYFYPHLTGREFCYYMGKLTDMTRSQIEDQIKVWGPRFKIDFALDREIRNYSKGMLQRVGFLATLLHNPKLIILDEPIAGVDPIGRKELKDVMLEINKQGTTVFFSSHIVSDVEEICDSVIFLKEGKLVFNGSVDQIIKDNIKPKVTIKYNEKDTLKLVEVSDADKNSLLTELINKNCEILAVNPEKPTLEEIFYNVK